MSLNSVNTNMGAMIALKSLNRTNADLAATQKRVSTGYRVPTPPTTEQPMPWRSRSVPPSAH